MLCSTFTVTHSCETMHAEHLEQIQREGECVCKAAPYLGMQMARFQLSSHTLQHMLQLIYFRFQPLQPAYLHVNAVVMTVCGLTTFSCCARVAEANVCARSGSNGLVGQRNTHHHLFANRSGWAVRRKSQAVR